MQVVLCSKVSSFFVNRDVVVDLLAIEISDQEFITSLLTGGAFPAAWIFDSADKDADGLSASGSNGASTGGF